MQNFVTGKANKNRKYKSNIAVFHHQQTKFFRICWRKQGFLPGAWRGKTASVRD